MAMSAVAAPRPPNTATGADAPPRDLRRAAEEAAKRSFLRLVSHELRTPLNSIIGFSEIIAGELHGPIGEPRYREHAEMVRDAGLKLLKLVNDVIDLARLEAGVIDLDLQAEDPLWVVEETAEALADEAALRQVTLRVEGAETGPATIDPRALKAALTQLIQNAIAASPEGGVVRLALRRTPGGVAIDVADQGPGVPEGDIARLFRPFEQGENALTRRAAGAGLGLPIARGLCEAMGGKLRLHQHPGQGLCATLHLRAAG